MSLEREIQRVTVVQFKSIPTDGKSRAFKVGHKEWFALSFGSCGAFGCFSAGQLYRWDGRKTYPVEVVKPERSMSARQIGEEQKIVDICNGMMDRGEAMSELDLDRYILALTRVIEWKQKQARVTA